MSCRKKEVGRRVADDITRLKGALEAEDVVVGGGNAKKLKVLPDRSPARFQRQRFHRRLSSMEM
jgi:hypothetical protein